MPRFVYWLGIAAGVGIAGAGVAFENELMAVVGAAVVLLAWGELFGYGTGGED